MIMELHQNESALLCINEDENVGELEDISPYELLIAGAQSSRLTH